jgi:hypothetical protein
MALQAAERAGYTFAGFWHGGAFSRLSTVLAIAQWRVDSAARQSLAAPGGRSGRAVPL